MIRLPDGTRVRAADVTSVKPTNIDGRPGLVVETQSRLRRDVVVCYCSTPEERDKAIAVIDEAVDAREAYLILLKQRPA